MRVLGLIGLVLALLIDGVLVKKQTQALVAPASSAAPSTSVQQGHQLQQDFQKSLDAAMQPPRSMPDESP